MASRRQAKKKPKTLSLSAEPRIGKAPPHRELINELVHVFVDDQNLFWGIVNKEHGISYRIDFGRLLSEVSRDAKRNSRGVKSAWIAGIIPDDDSFWQVAKNQGFTVRRGYLGASNRSKQDDAYLITEITSTIYEQEGPSTIVLVAGDADYVPPLLKALEKGWRTEVAFISHGVSGSLVPVVHQFRQIEASNIGVESKGYRGPADKERFNYT